MKSLDSKPINKKLKPYQALVLLLYGRYEWAERDGDLLTVSLGPFARHMQITNYRLLGYLQWLEEMGFLEGLEHTYGKARFTLRRPQ